MISDLVDYLANNLLIAHYCGFDISRPLPSYWTFDRFLKNFDNDFLSDIMKSQVLLLAEKGIVDTSFIGLDSTQSLLTLPKIIRNPLYQKSSSRIISHLPILTVNLVCIPLPIKPMRKNTNSIGATKTMSLWTVFQGFPFMKSLRLLRSPIPLSLLIFWQILIHFFPSRNVPSLLIKAMM